MVASTPAEQPTSQSPNRAPQPSGTSRPKARKGCAWTALKLTLVASLLLLAASLLYRACNDDPHLPQKVLARLLGKKPHFTRDPEIGWVPTPNLDQDGGDPDGLGTYRFRTDSHGFRSPPPDPTFTGKRVVLLGDSMIWGVGVDQTRIAGAVLQTLLGPDFEVLVVGAPGWSTDQEFLFFEKYVQPFHPDIVVWFTTAVNDVVCNLFGQATSGVLYRKPRFELGPDNTLHLIPLDPDAPFVELGETVERSSSMLNLFYRKPDPTFRKGLELTAALLAHGGKLWQSRGMRVVYVFFKPNLITYLSENYRAFAEHFGYNPDDFSYDIAIDNIRFMAERAGIDAYFFDTRREWMFQKDGHLNDAGHAALARFVKAILDGSARPRWRFAPNHKQGVQPKAGDRQPR